MLKVQSNGQGIPHYLMFVAGEWIESSTGKRTEVVDPATETIIATCECGGRADCEKAIKAARRAFDEGVWRTASGAERSDVLRAAASLIRQRGAEFVEIETLEQGNLIGAQELEAGAMSGMLNFYAGLASDRQGQPLKFEAGFASGVTREPVGVVAAITPWNYPMSAAMLKIAPALAAGNAVICKPATITPLTTLMLAAALEEAGVPAGALQVITGPGGEVGDHLASSSLVDMVSLTGSVEVGAQVTRAGADTIKKHVLELGGKSANIVFADSDFEAALQGALLAAFTNAGQVCTAGTRLLLEHSIHDRFLEQLVARARALRIGPGSDRNSQMGPLASSQQLATVEHYVAAGVAEGATIMCGGQRFERSGYFYEPTIFAGVKPGMVIAREEIFGPVLSVLPFDTEDEAVALANDTDFGLAAGLWTTNLSRAMRVSSQLNAGYIWVNTWFALLDNAAGGGRKLRILCIIT